MKLIKLLLAYALVLLLIFLLGRIGLFVLYFERLADTDMSYWWTFLYGLRMDSIIVCAALLLPVMLFTLLPGQLKVMAGRLLTGYFWLLIFLALYIEMATFPFFAEYDVRPNFLFVEYLVYPQEVFNMIFSAYKVELFLGLSGLALVSYVYFKVKKWRDFSAIYELSYMTRLVLFIPLTLVLLVGLRSSFGHRPANISDAMYSNNRIINEITKNSIHSIAYAIYQNKKYSANKLDAYGKMDIKEAMALVGKALNLPLSMQSESPFRRLEPSHFARTKPKNLVIFLQESLGAQFVEATGGQPGLTPNLNRLSKEGLLFSNLFANGTRSIRGIAGTIAGSFSVPGKGVVKRNKSQTQFFTIASLLKPKAYKTLFFYGGESRFDNMRGWLLGNGFDEIIDQPRFIAPQFVGTWGVSDEDMVLRAHQEFNKMHQQGQQFAALMFSTSNHSPFDFPSGKIDLLPGIPEKSDLNAIKYADYAIGRFIEEAKKADYYQDTVFVIVADHNIRVRGGDMLPVNLYHIPALILGGGIKPQVIDRLSTQPDVLATALDLTGQDLTYPILGHSVFSDEKKDLSFMQFNDTFALRVADKVAIVRPDTEALSFRYQQHKMLPIEHDKTLEKQALAFILTMNYLYEQRLYR